MIDHTIRCEVLEVRTGSGVCPGLAKTRQGETYTFGARTPAARYMKCVLYGLRELIHILYKIVMFGYGPCNTGNICFLEGIITYQVALNLPGNCYHWDRIHVCCRDACNQVCGTRP